MEANKIEIDAYKAMEMLFKVIKPSKIAEGTDMSYSLMMRKAKKTIFRDKPLAFTQSNIDFLNQSIERIGLELQKINISYVKSPSAEEPNDTKKQMEVLKGYFQPSYIYTKLGKTSVWYCVRLKPYNPQAKNYYFSEDDILAINLAIREASSLLLNMKLMIVTPNS